MATFDDVQMLNLIHDSAYSLGLIIRDHVPEEKRTPLLDALLRHFDTQDAELTSRVCRVFEIALAQGIADAHRERTFETIGLPRCST